MTSTTESVTNNNFQSSNESSKMFTRQCIRIALLDLLKKHSFEKITITAIINRAGVSRAGFYNNYSSKDDILEDISSTIYQKMSMFYTKDINEYTPYERDCLLFHAFKEHGEWLYPALTLSSQNKHIFNLDKYEAQLLASPTQSEHYLYLAIAESKKAIIINWYKNGMKESTEEMAAVFSELYQNKSFFSSVK